ncbi:hypothetical protein ACOMHN_003002 [Nucella lapillus]
MHRRHNYTRGASLMHLDDIVCDGTESNLGHCGYRGWGNHDCRPDEAVAVRCFITGAGTPVAGGAAAGTVLLSGLAEGCHQLLKDVHQLLKDVHQLLKDVHQLLALCSSLGWLKDVHQLLALCSSLGWLKDVHQLLEVVCCTT